MNKKKIYNQAIKQYGSPLYIYDESIIRRQCRALLIFAKTLEDVLQRKVRNVYSIKANSNLSILQVVKESGLGADCMSPTEYKLNSVAGFEKEDMLYVCNNISEEEMEFVHETKLLPCWDSISQVNTWGKRFPGTKIMVRINPGVKGVGHSDKVKTSGVTKFGISESNFPELFKVAKQHNLTIVGTHQHLGSLFLNDGIDDYLYGVKHYLELVDKYFKDVKVVDLGGGFGVPYKPNEKPLDLKLLAGKLIPILLEFLQKNPQVEEFKFEPGRYIPCEAGELVAKVTATKYEEILPTFGIETGMGHLIRPAMYDAYHEVELIKQQEDSSEPIEVSVAGDICESGDIFARDRMLPKAEVGDLAIIKNAGAYGYSMASNYTGRLKPAEVMIRDNGKLELIRRRETLEDVLNQFPQFATLDN